jgi:hypothetical protein
MRCSLTYVPLAEPRSVTVISLPRRITLQWRREIAWSSMTMSHGGTRPIVSVWPSSGANVIPVCRPAVTTSWSGELRMVLRPVPWVPWVP